MISRFYGMQNVNMFCEVWIAGDFIRNAAENLWYGCVFFSW